MWTMSSEAARRNSKVDGDFRVPETREPSFENAQAQKPGGDGRVHRSTATSHSVGHGVRADSRLNAYAWLKAQHHMASSTEPWNDKEVQTTFRPAALRRNPPLRQSRPQCGMRRENPLTTFAAALRIFARVFRNCLPSSYCPKSFS